jgi:hypothetical protein
LAETFVCQLKQWDDEPISVSFVDGEFGSAGCIKLSQDGEEVFLSVEMVSLLTKTMKICERLNVTRNAARLVRTRDEAQEYAAKEAVAV